MRQVATWICEWIPPTNFLVNRLSDRVSAQFLEVFSNMKRKACSLQKKKIESAGRRLTTPVGIRNDTAALWVNGPFKNWFFCLFLFPLRNFLTFHLHFPWLNCPPKRNVISWHHWTSDKYSQKRSAILT